MRFNKSIKQLFNYNFTANFIIMNREKFSFITYKFLIKIKDKTRIYEQNTIKAFITIMQ